MLILGENEELSSTKHIKAKVNRILYIDTYKHTAIHPHTQPYIHIQANTYIHYKQASRTFI